ncbi:Methyltransferase domain-containing protein [Actinokineospora alba]|uniref:Methyltransferase domain-containing protein n=1 Tax=Actinokineospora alba TaxID=504798 RepID=A0A1H0K2C9_9PSEU|nr:class I SAM-dependent methyltransferase [Actinokineospora alba]TDP68071.1 methyltransferase family protein [Actinokineospora alba]SDH91872.1 Methyltransferase domain-containing protein [Actinokineospora alba]SDO50137.1 Methyltransferase domain-containing protein [Actinokineospora alba]
MKLDDTRQTIAETFDRTADTYDAVGVDFFGVFARQLLDDVGPIAGDDVLDIGCGRGAVLFPAAERVGPTGSVLGIDLSPAMVARTERDIADLGLDITVAVMDAQDPVLPGRLFDTILSSCVVFFLPDPIAALRAWHDLLRPGGRIGLTTFCGDDPRWSPVREVFGPYIPPEMIWSMVNPANPMASTENFESALGSAGFTSPSSVIREHEITFADPTHWVDWSWSHGQRLFWELIPPAEQPAVRAEVLSRLAPLRDPDGCVRMKQAVRYTVAHRP